MRMLAYAVLSDVLVRYLFERNKIKSAKYQRRCTDMDGWLFAG